MSERWKLTVKGMTGHLIHVDIADPQVCSVFPVGIASACIRTASCLQNYCNRSYSS